MKNATFSNLLKDKKNDLILACRNYEEDKETKRQFELEEALNWIVESLPVPA